MNRNTHAPVWAPVWVMVFALGCLLSANPCRAQAPKEIHDRIAPQSDSGARVALTLDACSGLFDADLIQFLVAHQIPATLFTTKKWLLANPTGVAFIRAHLDLFDVENHGENHIPAVIGAGKTVYGIPGVPDIVHLRREVLEGARSITELIGVPPHWYRGATAEYDTQAIAEIHRLGFGIAGFSVNGDAGATLREPAIAKNMAAVRDGDIIIAHMNKPASDTAEGLAVGLQHLLARGFRFVRLDQIEIQEVSPAPTVPTPRTHDRRRP